MHRKKVNLRFCSSHLGRTFGLPHVRIACIHVRIIGREGHQIVVHNLEVADREGKESVCG